MGRTLVCKGFPTHDRGFVKSRTKALRGKSQDGYRASGLDSCPVGKVAVSWLTFLNSDKVCGSETRALDVDAVMAAPHGLHSRLKER
jgi:hypothetical protein